jgi:hypothetical protein
MMVEPEDRHDHARAAAVTVTVSAGPTVTCDKSRCMSHGPRARPRHYVQICSPGRGPRRRGKSLSRPPAGPAGTVTGTDCGGRTVTLAA